MQKGGGTTVHLSRKTPELLEVERCAGTIECALAGAADEALLLAWLALLLITALASLAFLPRARELADRERTRTRAEYDAFDRFIAEVQSVTPQPIASAAEPAGSAPIIQRQIEPEGAAATEVEAAYRETVMAVPHFEEDYGETIAQHMQAELSEEIAHATLDGNGFGPHVKRGLLEAAADARERRADFLDLLDEECSSLERHAERLSGIEQDVERATAPLCADQSFDDLRSQRETLQDCRAAIQSLLDERQTDRTKGKNAVLRLNRDLDLQEYLYAPLEVTYPVFAEAARLLSQIDVAIRHVEDELIYRA